MVLAQPEQGVGDQEVADLVAAVVEHQRAPVGVLAAARVLVLVQRGAVEAREPELVAREVRRHPVEDHADAVLVHAVDELAEVVGRAVERRGREVAGHLVAPRALERVRHHRQQLDVRVAQVLDVRAQLVGELEVGERAVALERVEPPGPQVDLVDRDRVAQRLVLLALAQPLGVLLAPDVMRLEHHRGGLRRDLGGLGVRIGLEQDLVILGEDLVLVAGAGAHPGQEQLPDAGRAERAHGVQAAVPGVEVADHADRAGSRRPHGERGAGDRWMGWVGGYLDLAHVRAELVVELLVPTLADQVLVELADRRQECVGIVDRELAGVAVVDLELVAQRQLGVLDDALEHAAGMDLLQLGARLAVDQHGHRAGGRAQRAHDHAAARTDARRARHAGWDARGGRARRALRSRRSSYGKCPSRVHALSSRRAMPATGIEIQSGRLSSS